MVGRGDWGGGREGVLVWRGLGSKEGIQHTPTYTRGDPEGAANTRGSRSFRQPPSLHISAEGSKLIWRTPNSLQQPLSKLNLLNCPCPCLVKFYSIWKIQRRWKMTGDEKAAAVEKSQLVGVEKSQQLKEEKKPNAPPTEWELLKLIMAVLIVGNDFVVVVVVVDDV